MKNFILDVTDNEIETNVTIGETTYQLRMRNKYGCVIKIFEHDVERDQIALTRTDMKAFFMLLTTDKEKL